jgi:hypothetical protein
MQPGACTAHDWLVILATGRSGSTTIESMLNAVPQVHLTGENGGVMEELEAAYSLNLGKIQK